MRTTVTIIVIVIVLLGGFYLYNRLVRLRNRTDNAWAQVDVQLRRRYDLIPNLVETVKGYAGHEKETLEAVTAARNSAVAADSIGDQGAAEGMLTGALRKLFALSESYPELRASQNFLSLQSDLGETENKIAVARQIYNDATLTYNNAVQTVPSNVVAALARFKAAEYFEIEGEARATPRVQF